MLLNIKNTKVYLVSPGNGKYRPRLQTVFMRLVDQGYTNIEFFRSIPDPSGSDSLTRTNIEIFKKEMNNDNPFIIIEDDAQLLFDYETVDIPDNTDALYLGVANWVYPHGHDTIGKGGYHIREHNEHDHISIDTNLTKISGMTGTHAIIYFNREYIRRFIKISEDLLYNNRCISVDLPFASIQSKYNVYALKQPMYYQDASLGGQEGVTKLAYNGQKYMPS